jgi:hypothetical protein
MYNIRDVGETYKKCPLRDPTGDPLDKCGEGRLSTVNRLAILPPDYPDCGLKPDTD